MQSDTALAERPTHVRHGILGLACGLSLITYLDRICISRVSGEIQTDLGISDFQMGLVFSAFLLGYLLMEIPSGMMGDAWGARRVITRIVLCWSLFTALTGLIWPFQFGPIDALVVLLVVRFLFGCGEAGAYPNLARVVGDWFPITERGRAQGAIWTSARIGGAIAPLVIGRLTVSLGGWRPAFWILGAVGVVWAVVFQRFFRDSPREHPGCNEKERGLIGPGRPPVADGRPAHSLTPWRVILLNGNIWAVCLASAGICFGWYFFLSWQFRFLQEVYGGEVSHLSSGWLEVFSGLPFLSGALGCFLGGTLSDRLVPRLGPRWSRSVIGLVGFSGAGLCFLATGFAPSLWQAVVLLCLASFLNDLAVPVLWTAATDIGGRSAATVGGLMNMIGGIGGIVSQPLIPVLRDRYDWSLAMTVLAAAWFIAALTWLRIDAGASLDSRASNGTES